MKSKRKKILNVGGGPTRTLPKIYSNYDQDLLDIDPNVQPDILCDARKLTTLPARKYDAIHCSHTLEHFYVHETHEVLKGFLHVLKSDGHAHIVVPDMDYVIKDYVLKQADINDTAYMAGTIKITYHDIIYGWGKMISNGNLFYAHKCGFTSKSITKLLKQVGFKTVLTACDGFSNIYAFAFKSKPDNITRRMLGCL